MYLPHVFEVTFHCRLREKRERQFEQNSFVQGECTCLHIAECRNISQRKLYCNPKDICFSTQNDTNGIRIHGNVFTHFPCVPRGLQLTLQLHLVSQDSNKLTTYCQLGEHFFKDVLLFAKSWILFQPQFSDVLPRSFLSA